MEKIYGYKNQDVLMLANYVKNKGNSSLCSVFEKYALEHGKAKGTVRNLYYALAKKSLVDKEFCDQYLGGKPISVSKIVEFNNQEEKDLIKRIMKDKSCGKSVRSSIMEMSNGDGKLALRYQNKYRNAIKNKPELILSIKNELIKEGVNVLEKTFEREHANTKIEKLKNEIDCLVNKISFSVRKENQELKEKIINLEKQNLKLLKLLYGNKADFACDFTVNSGENGFAN